MSEKKKRWPIQVICACLAAGVLGFGAADRISAYRTSAEQAENVITIGHVDVTLDEPNPSDPKNPSSTPGWPGNDNPKTKNQTQYMETPKNPTVTNTGSDDAMVFIRMTVPVENVTLIDAAAAGQKDGYQLTTGNSELFWFKQWGDAETAHANNFNKNWVELGSEEKGTDLKGKTRTYVFGYKNRLAKTAKTAPLFDKIQMRGILEGINKDHQVNDPEKWVQDVKIQVYAIQADNIQGADGTLIDTAAGKSLSRETLTYIFDTYANQNGLAARHAKG